MVDSEQLLYSQTRAYFPIPKLYVLQVGLETKKERLPEKVQYDMLLSESYVSATEKYGKNAPKPDLEATVHVYDFRMTLDEVLDYIEQETLPERFDEYRNDIRNYALVANGITYMQRTGNDAKYTAPKNVADVAAYLKLLLTRGIFVDLLSDEEVCDMTMAQFSRDDILIYQGREEEREKTEAERKKAREWLALGISSMAETYSKFGQPRETAKEAILEKYPDADETFIDSLIAKIYGK